MKPLFYCSNIHPGTTLADTLKVVREDIPQVRTLANMPAMPMGLRLSAAAAAELVASGQAAFIDTLQLGPENAIASVNAFPFDEFNEGVVKSRVYQPDWSTDERLTYTNQVAQLLAWQGLDNVSISTVPIGYLMQYRIRDRSNVLAQAAHNLALAAWHLAQLAESTGVTITLGLEPEPDCWMETLQTTIRTYESILYYGIDNLTRSKGLTRIQAEQIIRKHLGICIDTCHFSVRFEAPSEVLAALLTEGIAVSKIQLSAAIDLNLDAIGATAAKNVLASFDEPRYLHQCTFLQKNQENITAVDIAPALDYDWSQTHSVRAHYHLPLFYQGQGGLGTTANETAKLLTLCKAMNLAIPLEVETYTWSVLPTELQRPIHESIAQELAWVKRQLGL